MAQDAVVDNKTLDPMKEKVCEGCGALIRRAELSQNGRRSVKWVPRRFCGKKCQDAAHVNPARHMPGFTSWRSMLARCTNPQLPGYPDYGGRGIAVCQRWRDSLENFLADMGPKPSSKHSIERIDNDGNYEPGNCRWATRVEQQNNTRANRRITALGQSRTIAEWAREMDLDARTIHGRLRSGWREDEAVTAPACQNPIGHRRRPRAPTAAQFRGIKNPF